MSTTPINEMTYEQVLNTIFTKYSNLEGEIRRRYLRDAISHINPTASAGSFHEYESKMLIGKSAALESSLIDDHKEQILEIVFSKFIVPYLSQYEPARQFVEAYMLLDDICEKWGINPKLKREKLIRGITQQTTAAFL